MARDILMLNDEQQEVIERLDSQMKELFITFVRVDEAGLSITDALEAIGMEVPLFAKPAVNQLSGRLKEMKREVETEPT